MFVCSRLQVLWVEPWPLYFPSNLRAFITATHTLTLLSPSDFPARCLLYPVLGDAFKSSQVFIGLRSLLVLSHLRKLISGVSVLFLNQAQQVN